VSLTGKQLNWGRLQGRCQQCRFEQRLHRSLHCSHALRLLPQSLLLTLHQILRVYCSNPPSTHACISRHNHHALSNIYQTQASAQHCVTQMIWRLQQRNRLYCSSVHKLPAAPQTFQSRKTTAMLHIVTHPLVAKCL